MYLNTSRQFSGEKHSKFWGFLVPFLTKVPVTLSEVSFKNSVHDSIFIILCEFQF